MKNGYVKSIIKGALSIGMATMMIMPQSVYAKTRVSSVKNPTKVADERTKEMIEKFIVQNASDFVESIWIEEVDD